MTTESLRIGRAVSFLESADGWRTLGMAVLKGAKGKLPVDLSEAKARYLNVEAAD